VERDPLYQFSAWTANYDLYLVGLKEAPPSILNNHRVGRSLDALFDTDWASILTQLIVHTISEFNIELSRFHNDSTTVTVFGKYKNQNCKSSQKKELDESIRKDRVEKTGKRKLKTPEQITKAVQTIFEKHHSTDWFDWELTKQEIEYVKQKGKGRPGKNTTYIRIKEEKWSFKVNPNALKIKTSAITDGIFPLITNINSDTLSIKDILLKYKYQPFLEKRNEQLKSVFNVMPLCLKRVHRIEALMFIYFVVLLINALIERELRLAMKRENINALPLYPEQRKCKHPTTGRVITLFSNLRKHSFTCERKAVKTYHDPISELQKKILQLLNVPMHHYLSE
jgi:transposase